MSTTETLATVTDPDRHCREDFWGELDAGQDDTNGHDEIEGTDPAEYIAFQHIAEFVAPICAKTGDELSDPEFYLPKQHETPHGYVEYRQHRHRRRWNPETGYINWGESTSTGLPEVDYETYRTAAANYLSERGIRLTHIEEYEQLLDRFWHDPQYNSHDALAQFIRVVREREQD
ncbi:MULTISPECIES: hypothetical protein [Salinibaculum]|uniref:hypothetical protein n=1 Tax=Salinibaculum TaxID=2732368 RepID=UPI0030CBDEE2